MSEEHKRNVVIPGETILEGDNYLPGEGTEKQGKKIVAMRYGLADESNKLVKVIPLSGVYQPRRGNIVIGKCNVITFNGWVIDIGTAENAFLPLTETPRFVAKDRLDEVMKIGDIAVVQIFGINGRGIDLTIKSRGLGRIDEGLIFKINPNKVPRVIGKEGSMIKIIKDYTNCNITVGQNGFIWIKGDKIEDELFAKKAIEFVTEKSFMEGLTEKVEQWLEKQGAVKKESKKYENKGEENDN
ncbi:MAG: exosome complex RNA-binding protein Rrp4 [Candidatus Diapherotrites archaeon]